MQLVVSFDMAKLMTLPDRAMRDGIINIMAISYNL
jgi:hypothetical protein